MWILSILLFCFVGSFALGCFVSSRWRMWATRKSGDLDDLNNVEDWTNYWKSQQ